MFYEPQREIEIVSSGGTACPVCGESGTNCKGESDYQGSVNFLPTRPQDDPQATYTVPRRIYTTTVVGTRTVEKLLYSKGARIRPEEARRLGLLPSEPVAIEYD